MGAEDSTTVSSLGSISMAKASAENEANGCSDAGGVIADAKAQAAVDTKGIAELVIKTAEDVGTGRRVGLRGVLAKDLRAKARVFLQVITESE